MIGSRQSLAFLSDRAVFRTWVDEVHKYLMARCGDRALAEDLTQEAFMAALRHAEEHPDQSLTIGWLVTVARNRLIDHVRRTAAEQRRMAAVGAGDNIEWPDDPVDGERAARALDRLPSDQRMALLLHHVDGLPIAEVAAALQRSGEAVQSLLARARRAFARAYGEVSDGD